MKVRFITGLLAGAVLLSPMKAQAPAYPPPELFRSMTADDPNRDPNWQFWINQPYTFYYNQYGSVHVSGRTVLPYFDIQYNPLWENSLHPDVFPADGWVLVMRDFGTPTAAPFFPYFALYNKYRGILRLFILNSWGLDKQHYATSIQFQNPTSLENHSALFTYTAKDKSFLKDYDHKSSLVTLSNMALAQGWSHFDFILAGYDPSLKNKPNAALFVKTEGINVANLEFDAAIYGSLEQMLNNAPVTFSRSDMETMEAALGKGFSYFKGTEDAMSKLKKATLDPQNSQKTWLQAAIRIVAAYYSGGYSEAIPWIAGAIGFITEFMGGETKPAPMQPMNFKVQLDLKAKGSLTTATYIYSPSFYLNYKANLEHGQQAPVQPIPWGVFNVDEKPKVMIQETYTWAQGSWIEPDLYEPDIYWIYTYTYPNFSGYSSSLVNAPTIHLNPDCGMSLRSAKVAYTYGEYDKPSEMKDYHMAPTDLNRFLPQGLAYELKFDLLDLSNLRYASPTQVFMKTYPIELVTGPQIGWFEAFTEVRMGSGPLPY